MRCTLSLATRDSVLCVLWTPACFTVYFWCRAVNNMPYKQTIVKTSSASIVKQRTEISSQYFLNDVKV